MGKANKLRLVKLISFATIMLILCVGVFLIAKVVVNKGNDKNDTTKTAILLTPNEAYKESSFTSGIRC